MEVHFQSLTFFLSPKLFFSCWWLAGPIWKKILMLYMPLFVLHNSQIMTEFSPTSLKLSLHWPVQVVEVYKGKRRIMSWGIKKIPHPTHLNFTNERDPHTNEERIMSDEIVVEIFPPNWGEHSKRDLITSNQKIYNKIVSNYGQKLRYYFCFKERDFFLCQKGRKMPTYGITENAKIK